MAAKSDFLKTDMKGRMPFPDPITPMVLVAVAITALFSTCFRFLQNRASPEPKPQIEETASGDEEYDPFTNEIPKRDNSVPGIAIKTKFVEIGSGTEELSFDWIVAPFDFETDGAAGAETED